jgi:hypothetical protein
LNPTARTPIVSWFLLLLTLSWSVRVSAAPPPQISLYFPTPLTASELAVAMASRDSETIHVLDRWHDDWFLSVQSTLERFDTRQAKSADQVVPVPVSPFRVGLDVRVLETRDTAGTDVLRSSLAGDFDISLHLPNLQSRLNLFLTTDELDERTTVEQWESVRAGLRLDLPQSIDLELGARLSAPLAAFLALRWGVQHDYGRWTVEPFAKVFVETDDGVGASASLIAAGWQGPWLLRSTGSLRWLADTDTTNWSQAVTIAKVEQMLGADRFSSRNRSRDLVHSTGLRLEARGERLSRVDTYEASLSFKRAAHSNWLFWRVEPLVSFDRRQAWRADPGIRIGLDALFWDLAAR